MKIIFPPTTTKYETQANSGVAEKPKSGSNNPIGILLCVRPCFTEPPCGKLAITPEESQQ